MRGRKISRTILSLVTAILIICTIGTNVSAATRFFDVDPSHPYYRGVMWATGEAKIANGYAIIGLFGIDDPCTRGHAMMFLWKLAGKPAPDTSKKMPFSDVPTNHDYYRAILWGSQSKITKGYPDGTFGIDRECTRGEILIGITVSFAIPGCVLPKKNFAWLCLSLYMVYLHCILIKECHVRSKNRSKTPRQKKGEER